MRVFSKFVETTYEKNHLVEGSPFIFINVFGLKKEFYELEARFCQYEAFFQNKICENNIQKVVFFDVPC